MKKIWEAIKAYFAEIFKPSAPKEIIQPVHKYTPTLNDELVDLCKEDVGQRETNGPNRSKMIDEINTAAGVDLGSRYCIAGILYRGVFTLCKQHNLKMPINIEASTQEFWRKVPSKYKRLPGTQAKKGDIGVMQSRSDSSKGHAYLMYVDEDTCQETIEYNTNPNGSRDGDGVWLRQRSQSGDASKKYLGAVDICQWIRDLNNYNEIVTIPEKESSPYLPLSWEIGHRERKAWSDYLINQIANFHFESFDKAKDAVKLYDRYESLKKWQKINLWAEFICSLCYYECSWDPLQNSVDVGEKGDIDTYSVGLMQLSVVDQKNYKISLGYKFKDLQDPIKNLNLGLKIMTQIIETKGIVMVPKGSNPYWGTLSGGKYDKSSEILARVKKLTDKF